MEPLITFQGKVIEGNKRGKQLGYPTANIALTIQIPEGIYISLTSIAGQQYSSLTFIGSAKTFNESTYQAETYILDFSQEIYEEVIETTLLKKIRENQKFGSVEDLIRQMKKDEKEARNYFSSYK